TEFSDNTVYAQLTQIVGPAGIVRTAKSLGITSPLKSYFAIGLGAEAVNPLEMARAFSAFANGGRRIDGAAFGNHPRAISVVRNQNERVVDDNRPVHKAVLTQNTAALVTSLLQSVVAGGTGKLAKFSDGRPQAGKTGTTENYGDAWFVGYTPQLVAAVWVGYPKGLQPMLTEFHGRPVVGGTYPALIWKTFMESALKEIGARPASFPSPPYLSVTSRRVTYRDGKIELDNGRCHDVSLLVYFTGHGPPQTANCRRNEVEVPDVVGWRLDAARVRLQGQPLTPQLVYKPARPGQRINVVLRQFPRTGRLSSF